MTTRITPGSFSSLNSSPRKPRPLIVGLNRSPFSSWSNLISWSANFMYDPTGFSGVAGVYPTFFMIAEGISRALRKVLVP